MSKDWRDNGPEMEAARKKVEVEDRKQMEKAVRDVATWDFGVVRYFLYRVMSPMAWESMKETSEDNQREYAAEMLFLERDGEFGNATVFVCGPEDLGGE